MASTDLNHEDQDSSLPQLEFADEPVPVLELAPQHEPRVWTVFALFLVSFVMVFVACGIAVAAIVAFNHRGIIRSPDDFTHAVEEMAQTPLIMFVAIFCTGGVYAFGSIIAAAISPVPFTQRLGLRPPRLSVIGYVVAVLGTLSVSMILMGLDGMQLTPQSLSLSEITKFLRGLRGPSLLLGLFAIGILPGIAEELLFRGYLQTRLVERWGTHVGVWVTAVLFGVMHLDPVQGTFAFALGVFLGYLTVWSRSIVPAMICHATNNSLSVLLTTLLPENTDEFSFNFAIALVFAGLVILPASLWFLRDHATQDPRMLAETT